MTDENLIEAMYRGCPPTVPRPPAGVSMADFWRSAAAGSWMLFLTRNVAPKLRPQLVATAARCLKLAFDTACAKRADIATENSALVARCLDVVERWLRGAASAEQVDQLGMAAIAVAWSGDRPDLSLELADAAARACFTARNAGYYDEDDKHGRPDRSTSLAVDAVAAQYAAVDVLIACGISRSEAWQRVVDVVRTEFPWSVIEPLALALAEV